MSETSLLQISQFLGMLLGQDPAGTSLVIQAAMAIGSVCGALWGTAQGARFSWRSLVWVGIAFLAGWAAFQKRRAISRRAKEIASSVMEAERYGKVAHLLFEDKPVEANGGAGGPIDVAGLRKIILAK